ncbi:glycosyltransferase family 2 protein [Thomasclavelia saccharogumia]|uniref:glycosyltransferase family 2 protein n=1 Tax=Thomasclavelia saccharogumia TaxID=341225 RepID=UPI00047A1CC9|nr:glycosyltransferase [Thomasclavelia saccharogumia]
MKYKISIIMGIYNCASTLDEAIQSLLNQTYKDWKLIMCDDASSDDTYLVAKKYADKYENIILISNNENKGLNYTLNHCLKFADTKYIARMDGDDISLPTRLEKEVDFLENNPEYAIVGSNMIYFDETGDWGKSNSLKKPHKADFIKGTPFCHASCLVRNEAYKAVKGYSEGKNLLRVEDYHLWYKMYLNGFKGYNIEESLYKMRDDRNAINRRKYRYRINETYVRYLIVKNFKLSKINYLFILRPLAVGLLPNSVYEFLHKKRMKS